MRICRQHEKDNSNKWEGRDRIDGLSVVKAIKLIRNQSFMCQVLHTARMDIESTGTESWTGTGGHFDTTQKDSSLCIGHNTDRVESKPGRQHPVNSDMGRQSA